ncbi:hypothetical protein CIT26_00315 [Mesorhizobium temperatum]|uniref:Uncharacterized protein n=1 Tax=Mesorhizobium temperatum TaxID=241416 RepID=A0A271LZ32_9HYPH|nr:hypothetical protein CIT26_00315 [Mesorhizobium temperatum]
MFRIFMMMLRENQEESASLLGAQSVKLFGHSCHVIRDGTSRVRVERDPLPSYVLKGESA